MFVICFFRLKRYAKYRIAAHYQTIVRITFSSLFIIFFIHFLYFDILSFNMSVTFFIFAKHKMLYAGKQVLPMGAPTSSSRASVASSIMMDVLETILFVTGPLTTVV